MLHYKRQINESKLCPSLRHTMKKWRFLYVNKRIIAFFDSIYVHTFWSIDPNASHIIMVMHVLNYTSNENGKKRNTEEITCFFFLIVITHAKYRLRLNNLYTLYTLRIGLKHRLLFSHAHYLLIVACHIPQRSMNNKQ